MCVLDFLFLLTSYIWLLALSNNIERTIDMEEEYLRRVILTNGYIKAASKLLQHANTVT